MVSKDITKLTANKNFFSLFYGELHPSIWKTYSDLANKLEISDIVLVKKWIENILYIRRKDEDGVKPISFRDLEYLYETDIELAKKTIFEIYNRFKFFETFKILKKWSKKHNKTQAFLKSSHNVVKIYREINEIILLMSHENVSISRDEDIFFKSYDGYWITMENDGFTNYILKRDIGIKDPEILQGLDLCRYMLSLYVTDKGVLYINDYVKSENAKYLFDILRVLDVSDIDSDLVESNNGVIVKQLYEYLNLKAPLKLYVNDDNALTKKLRYVFEYEQNIQFYNDTIIFNFVPSQIANFLKFTYLYDAMLEEILLKGVYGYNVDYVWKNIVDKEELKSSFNLLNNVQVELLREKYISFYTIFEAIEMSLNLEEELKKLEYRIYNHFDVYYNNITQRCEIDILKYCKFIIQYDDLNTSKGWNILERYYRIHNKEKIDLSNVNLIPDSLTLTRNLVRLISNQSNINEIIDEFNVVKL